MEKFSSEELSAQASQKTFKTYKSSCKISLKLQKLNNIKKFQKRFFDSIGNPKYHCSLLKILQNGKKDIPCIPQIFDEDNFIVNFEEKNEVINTSFAKRFSLLDNRIHLYLTLAFLYANQQKNQMFMILKHWTR